MVPSRIYYDMELKRYADEHIEIPYAQIQARTLSAQDRAAMPDLIDPYGYMCLGGRYRQSIAVPLCSRLQAAAWASQFGHLHVYTKNDRGQTRAYIQGHCVVYASTLEDACMLAGLQVLRELSIAVLSTEGQSVN